MWEVVIDRLLVATTNAGKAAEFAAMFEKTAMFEGHQVRSLRDFDDVGVAPENEDTFAGNAHSKASYYHQQLHARGESVWCLADDSGLEVDALGGRPGVHSARYAGLRATDASNVERLLGELAGVPTARRGARFVCALVLLDPAGNLRAKVRGTCEGSISDTPRGTGGFGYDPVFIPVGETQTFAERPELKKVRSHRAAAMSQLLQALAPPP